jgi:membrane-associated protease RseP (regulator of RpoE activity)
VYSTWGREQETGSVRVTYLADGPTAARTIGLQEGDVIVSIGKFTLTSRKNLFDVVMSYAPGDNVSIVYVHDGTTITKSVELGAHPGSSTLAYLGVSSSSRDYTRLEPHVAIGHAVTDMFTNTADSVRGIATALNPINSIRHLTNSDASLATRPTTVVGASQVGGAVGRADGLKGVLLMLASLNVFVGVFNMLPLLPFDGGHAAIATYERFRSRRGRAYRADISKMVPVATVVVGLLGLLLLTGLYLDITRPLG